jgi:hypothetical protein
MSTLPAAVQAQIDAANAIVAEMQKPAEPAAEVQAEVTQPGNEPAPVEVQGEIVEIKQDAVVELPAPTEKKVENGSWEQKYLGMKGRFERLMDQVRAQEQHIAHLQSEVARLGTVQVQPLTAQTKFVTPEEEAEYGPEFLSVVEKKARELADPLQQQLAEVKQTLTAVTQQSELAAKREFNQSLTNLVEDWRETNRSEEFKSWLQEVDAYTGQRRHDMLLSAHQQKNAVRVAAFFQNFRKEVAAVAPRGTSQTQAPKPSLEAFAAPGRAKSAAPAPSGSEDKTFITNSDIAEFYTNKRLKRYTPEEETKYEAQIFKAQREGRVVPR